VRAYFCHIGVVRSLPECLAVAPLGLISRRR
jgi:hypothetical protein